MSYLIHFRKVSEGWEFNVNKGLFSPVYILSREYFTKCHLKVLRVSRRFYTDWNIFANCVLSRTVLVVIFCSMSRLGYADVPIENWKVLV